MHRAHFLDIQNICGKDLYYFIAEVPALRTQGGCIRSADESGVSSPSVSVGITAIVITGSKRNYQLVFRAGNALYRFLHNVH